MKYKHFLSALLGLFMLQIIAMPKITSAESNKIETFVVSETDADKAVCFLEGLGIDTSFKSEETITRAQFTSLIVDLAYDNILTASFDAGFEDVLEGNKYYNEINFACDADIVSKNSLFRPDDAVTYGEATAMALRALGYGYVCEYYGGYPTGYMKYASETKLNVGIYKGTNEKLSGTDALMLLYNMLVVDFMERDFRGDGVSYFKKEGHNILTDTYSLKGTIGTVTATVYSDLSGVSTVNDDNIIKIGGREYKFFGDSFDLLGMKVIAYVNRDNEAVIVCPVNNQILKAYEVESFKNFTLEIKNGKSTKNVKLDSSFCFIYNGVAYNTYNAKDFTDFEGYVKLVDNNGDNVYDVVFIYDVEYMKVSQVDKLHEKIYGKSISRDYISYDEDSHIRFYDSSEEISAFDVKVNNILAIMMSKDGKVGKVEIINNEIYGTIEELDDKEIKIEGTAYKRSSHLNKFYSLMPGTTATFYLGLFNDVIMIQKDKTGEYHYGYFVDIAKDPNTDIYSLKIYTENGELEVYECLEKLDLNGSSIKTYNKWKTDAYPLTDTSNVAKRQLIKYKLTDGSISAIDTINDAVSENALDQMADNEKDSLIRYFDRTKTQYYTTSGVYTFKIFNVDSQTLIISVPDPDAANVEEADFNLKEVGTFKKDSSYTVDAYDLNENGVASVVLVYDSSSTGLTDSSVYGIVDKISEVWHDDLGLCKKVTLWRSGECYSYYMEINEKNLHLRDDGTPLETGDVIHIYLKNDVIKDLEVIFDSKTKELTARGVAANGGNEDKTQSSRAFLYSSNYKMTDKYFVVSRKKTDGKWDYSLDNLRYIPLYNDASIIVVEDGQVKKIYSDEILDYCSSGEDADELFIIQGYWGTSSIVIYR